MTLAYLHQLALFLTILSGFLVAFAACGTPESQVANNLKRDHAEISKLLDKALLSENPIDSFNIALPKVQSFSSVDTAWIDGSTFYVKYKAGGVITWSVTPRAINDTTKTREQ